MKSKLILRDIAPHYDLFKTPRARRLIEEIIDTGLHEIVGAEAIVERALADASNGKYTFINAAHCDYSDGSECKTASLRATVKNGIKSTISFHGDISNLSTSAGVYKTGDLRVVIYNPLGGGSLMYYYLPLAVWRSLVSHGGSNASSNKGRIMFSFSANTLDIPKFRGYEVGSFEELAKK